MNKFKMDEIRKLAMQAANKAYADVMKTASIIITASEYGENTNATSKASNIYESYNSISRLAQVRKKTQPSWDSFFPHLLEKKVDKDIHNIIRNNNDRLDSVKITNITMFDPDFQSDARAVEFGQNFDTGDEARQNSVLIYVDGCKLTTFNKIKAYLKNEIKNGEYCLMYYKNIKPN